MKSCAGAPTWSDAVIFRPTVVDGAFVIELEPRADERGSFARSFCRREFEERGLNSHVEQCNVSTNAVAGTLRGLHFQRSPHEEAKLVRCTRGALWDAVLDLRPSSPSYLRWFGVELDAERRRMVFVPEGCAHGFQTITDWAEVFYQVSGPYVPEAATGVRWDDPTFGIEWPHADRRIMSENDSSWPDYLPPRRTAS
jgi:dTDP-4-dehydrorhamnose 3,5-epimerase